MNTDNEEVLSGTEMQADKSQVTPRTPVKKETSDSQSTSEGKIGVLKGYLINVTPKGEKSFDFMIQESSTSCSRVLCYSPLKRKAVTDLNKTPVKILNLRKARKGSAYIMDDETALESLESEEIDYEPLDMDDLKIKDIKKCAEGSVINIKAFVSKRGEPTMSGRKNRYQILALADETGVIKCMFYDSMIDECVQLKSYDFKNLQVKVDTLYGDCYVSSTYDNTTSVEEIAQVSNVKVNEESSRKKAEKEVMNGEIVAAGKINRFILCSLCKLKLHEKTKGQLKFECTKCNTTLKRKLVLESLALHVTFEHKDDGKRQEVSIFNSVLDPYLDIKSYGMNDDEIRDRVLEADEVEVSINSKNTITSISAL